MNKKIKRLLLVISIGIMSALGVVYASEGITVELNGQRIVFDAKPFISNERTLVPIRAITEAMECNVKWNPSDKTAIISNDEISVNITIDQSSVAVTDLSTGKIDYVYADAPAEIYQDRTYVPLRVLSEAFGAEVNWIGADNLIEITYNQDNQSVSFDDKAFEYSVRVALGHRMYGYDEYTDKLYEGEITRGQLKEIQYLTLMDEPDGAKLTSISDISKIKNIQRLSIDREVTKLKDISPILDKNSDISDPVFELCVRLNIADNYDDEYTDDYMYIGSISDSMMKKITRIDATRLPSSLRLGSLKDLKLTPNVVSLVLKSVENIDDYSIIGDTSEWKYLGLNGLKIQDDSFLDEIYVTDEVTFPNLGYCIYIVDMTGTGNEYQYPQALSLYRKTLDKMEDVETIVSEAKTDYDKYKAIHDYVVLNMKYDWDAYRGKRSAITHYPHNLSEFFFSGKGVCADYSTVFAQLCEYFELECWMVGGEADGAYGWDEHAWNIVKLDGNYYHVDTTWDDPDSGKSIDYRYFLVSDKKIGADHTWDRNDWVSGYADGEFREIEGVPVCNKNYS